MSGRMKLAGYAALGMATAATLASAIYAAVPAPAPLSKNEIDSLLFERENIMLQLDKDGELLGMIAAGLAPKEKLAATTRAIAQGAKDAQASFVQNIPGGRTKPEVWANRADFDAQMQRFVTKSEEMAKLGEAGNLGGVTEAMIDAMPCKQCHDLYRAPKKPG